MKAKKSKLLFDIAWKPIVKHIIDAAKMANSKQVVCVVNNKSPSLKKILLEDDVKIAVQQNIDGNS